MKTHAQYVFYRAQEKDVAVFVDNGRVMAIDAYGDRAKLMMQDFPHRMAGVYNKDATLEMIEEDLACLR
jgi:hypothetical protein